MLKNSDLAANVHLRTFDILDNFTSLLFTSFAQACMNLATFRYMEEIASGAAYEGRKGFKGNTQPGDGKRFPKGRGPEFNLTGRANYRKYGQQLGIDFENNPEVVAIPSIGLMVALQVLV